MTRIEDVETDCRIHYNPKRISIPCLVFSSVQYYRRIGFEQYFSGHARLYKLVVFIKSCSDGLKILIHYHPRMFKCWSSSTTPLGYVGRWLKNDACCKGLVQFQQANCTEGTCSLCMFRRKMLQKGQPCIKLNQNIGIVLVGAILIECLKRYAWCALKASPPVNINHAFWLVLQRR